MPRLGRAFPQRTTQRKRKLFLFDSFTGTNGTALTSHTGELGAAWTTPTGASGAGTIQGNRLTTTGGSGATETHTVASATPQSADYYVGANIFVVSLLTFAEAGVMARALTTANTGYAAFFYYDGAAAWLYLKKYVAGTGTDLNAGGTSVAVPAVSSLHAIGIGVVGSAITLFWDRSPAVGPITDTAITAAGKPAVFGVGNTTTTGFHHEDVLAA